MGYLYIFFWVWRVTDFELPDMFEQYQKSTDLYGSTIKMLKERKLLADELSQKIWSASWAFILYCTVLKEQSSLHF